jgi:arsenate reductase
MLESNNKKRVLCLDRENSIRSQMAEAFIRFYGNDKFDIFSGGTEPMPIHPLTIQVMDEIGLSLAQHHAKSAQQFFGHGSFQFAIMISHPNEKDCPRLFPGALRIERWPNPNPLADLLTSEEQLTLFRSVRDRIRKQAQTWVQMQRDIETGIFSKKLNPIPVLQQI